VKVGRGGPRNAVGCGIGLSGALAVCGTISDAVATTVLIETCDGSRVLAWSQTQMGHGMLGRSEPSVVDETTRSLLDPTSAPVRPGVTSTST